MEYCENNNLKEFLSKNSGGFLDEIENVDELTTPDGYLAPTHTAAQANQLYKVSMLLFSCFRATVFGVWVSDTFRFACVLAFNVMHLWMRCVLQIQLWF